MHFSREQIGATPATAMQQGTLPVRSWMRGLFGAVLLGGALATGAIAQDDPNPIAERLGVTDETADSQFGLGTGNVVVAPIPFENPSIGYGLGLLAQYYWKTDAGSDPSSIGVTGFRSSNDSSGQAVLADISLRQNTWKLSGFAGSIDLFYDFFTPAGSLPLRQKSDVYRLDVSYEVVDDLYLGVMTRYYDTTVGLAGGGGLPVLLAPDADVEILSFGAILNWDRRDNTLYPTSGDKVSASAIFNDVQNLAGRDYSKAQATYDRFTPLGENGVLAGRASVCAATSDAPFFDACALGRTDKFRGFETTRHLDNTAVSLQVEYRHRFSPRFGVVAFAGIGSVGPSFDSFGAIQYAGGVGARLRLSQQFPVDFSADVTINDEADSLLYVYVGQRF